jgi:phenylacetic acid degradation operon negative regulatory protein
MRSLFCLDEWEDDAKVLIEAMDIELERQKRDDSTESFTYEFAVSIAVVRHLQRDPLLPVELISDQWPGGTLRSTYRRFDDAFKKRVNVLAAELRSSVVPSAVSAASITSSRGHDSVTRPARCSG